MPQYASAGFFQRISPLIPYPDCGDVVKKPKLDTEADAKAPEGEQADDADEELPEEAADEPVSAMDVDQPPSTTAAPAEPKIRFKKGKTAEGAGAHLKENPYTFIEPDDPIVKACM